MAEERSGRGVQTIPPWPAGYRADRVPWVVALALPYPPSVNHLYRMVGGKMLKSAEGRAYHQRVAELVWAALREPDTWQPEGRLRVLLDVFPPDRRRRDLDNLLKQLGDSLCRGLGVDDSTIDEWHIRRRESRRAAGVFVVVTPVSLGAY